jgi:hypothetical protein
VKIGSTSQVRRLQGAALEMDFGGRPRIPCGSRGGSVSTYDINVAEQQVIN